MPSIGIAGIFTIIRLDKPNLQKIKSPTRLSSQKLICLPVQILERPGRERTGKRQQPSQFYSTLSLTNIRFFALGRMLCFFLRIIFFLQYFSKKFSYTFRLAGSLP